MFTALDNTRTVLSTLSDARTLHRQTSLGGPFCSVSLRTERFVSWVDARCKVDLTRGKEEWNGSSFPSCRCVVESSVFPQKKPLERKS